MNMYQFLQRYSFIQQTSAFVSIVISCLSLISCSGNSTENEAPEVVSTSLSHFVHQQILGGDTTDIEYSGSSHAYSQPAANLVGKLFNLHMQGDASFETAFIGSSSSDVSFSGLGPVQNHTNCDACHQRDGRANLPALEHLANLNSYLLVDENGYYKIGDSGVFLRISIENSETVMAGKDQSNCWGAPVAVPGFSTQLFQRGSIGVRLNESGQVVAQGTGQADLWMKYEYKDITYPDGSGVTLSKPVFFVDNPYDAPDDPNTYNPITVADNSSSRLFRPDVRFGARIGSPVFGLGLLGAISEQEILALADSEDSDGDGISGRPNWVCDQEKLDICSADNSCTENPAVSLGRFGWKANTPTVAHQGLGALRGDMGVTNPLFPEESIAGTPLMQRYKDNNPDFRTFEDTGVTDADAGFSRSVVFYSETLSVPPRREHEDADVQQGAMIFERIACTSCHTPSFVTNDTYMSFSVEGERIAELENQTIYPFTDMLLHDMGEELSDGRQDTGATAREWKTRPLWGIGVTQTVNPGAGFLHDGRARTLEEAILWHGGEAEATKLEFMALSASKRSQLIKFLQSL